MLHPAWFGPRSTRWNRRHFAYTMERQSGLPSLLSGIGSPMFKVRVIACLGVKDGRVVKGVKFLDLGDAQHPAAAAIAYSV
jgi:hypothetical protein